MKSSLTIFFAQLVLITSPLIQGNAKAVAQQRPNQRDLRVESAKTITSLPSASKRFALVVGVDQYQDTQINRLDGAGNDAKATVEALVQYAGFPREQVVLLTSDQPVERQPTRGNILRRLSNLRTTVPPEGLLLIAFSGHGIERGGQAYLLPADAQVSGDVSLLEDTAINAEEMRKRIVQTGVRQIVMIIDACRNDPASGRGDADNPLTKRYTDAFNFEEKNAEIQAFATLYATDLGHRAYEYKEKQQGYFTWALVEGLKGAAANDRGEVTLSSLLTYLQDAVPRRIRMDLGPGTVQKPFAIVQGYRASDLILAKTAAAEAVAIPDPPQIQRSYWDKTLAKSDPATFRDYLKQYPKGVFAEEALWEAVRGSKDPEDFKSYVRSYPTGKNVRVAAMLAEDTLWEQVQVAKSPADFQRYLKDYPNGRYSELAIRRLQPPAAPPKIETEAPKPQKAVLMVLTNAPTASVLIKPSDPHATPVQGQADADGKFRAELAHGVYDIEVSAARYSPRKMQGLKFSTDDALKLDLTSLVGSIQIGPVDPDASVLLDGVKPASVVAKRGERLIELGDVSAGMHRLKIVQPDKSEWAGEVTVEGGRSRYVATEFKLAVATLLVRTEPEAEVYVDDFYAGRASDRGELKVANLSAGQHNIKAKKNEFQPAEQTKHFAAGGGEITLALTRVVFSPEFGDDFTGGISAWRAPATWQASAGRLSVKGEGIGTVKDYSYKDFRMEFDVIFANGKGAVWLLRSQDSANYYLCQLTGPSASSPNVFRIFLYQNGQQKLLKVFRVPENLGVVGDKFHIIVEATGPEIKHLLQVKSNPKATQPQPFAVMTDSTFSNGRIGFGSLEGEEFIVQFVSVVPRK